MLIMYFNKDKDVALDKYDDETNKLISSLVYKNTSDLVKLGLWSVTNDVMADAIFYFNRMKVFGNERVIIIDSSVYSDLRDDCELIEFFFTHRRQVEVIKANLDDYGVEKFAKWLFDNKVVYKEI